MLTRLHAYMHARTKKPPKIHPKTSQKPPKNLPKSGQEGLQNHSCWVLAAKRPQDASKTLQDIPKKAFWRRPGNLRGVLGRKSGQGGSKLAPQNGAKIRLEASWGRLGGVLRASWPVLGSSWDDFQGMSSWKLCFNRFLMVFPSKNQFPKLQKS